MKTPGSHNDVYAPKAHRHFFKCLAFDNLAPVDCRSDDPGAVDGIDALTVTLPVIIRYSEVERDVRNQKVVEAINTIRKVKETETISLIVSDMIVSVLHGTSLKDAAQAAADKANLGSLQEMIDQAQGQLPMAPCPIQKSFPALLFLVYKYHDKVEEGILANANGGGENVARGVILGALYGAAYGMEGFPEWAREGLVNKVEILKEAEILCNY